MSKRPDVYKSEAGVWQFRASSLGTCTRGLVAARLGVQPQPPKEKLKGYLDESSLAEQIVRTELLRKGYRVGGDQANIELDFSGGIVTGHLDGYVDNRESSQVGAGEQTLRADTRDESVVPGISSIAESDAEDGRTSGTPTDTGVPGEGGDFRRPDYPPSEQLRRSREVVDSDPPGRGVLEIKSFGRTLFEKYVRGGIDGLGEPFSRMYKMQLSCYMHATGLPALLVIYSKEHGMSLEKWVMEPYYSMSDISTRIDIIHEWAEDGKYPPCDAKCGAWSWYWWIHEKKEEARDGDDVLGEKMRRLVALKKELVELQNEHDELRDEVKEEIGHGTLSASGVTGSVARFFKKMTDYGKMRREMGDEVFAPYENEREEFRLTVKED